MARIAIGVCGEGRGHAARAATLLERLGDRHEFLVASTDEALELVAGRAGAARRAPYRRVPPMVAQGRELGTNRKLFEQREDLVGWVGSRTEPPRRPCPIEALDCGVRGLFRWGRSSLRSRKGAVPPPARFATIAARCPRWGLHGRSSRAGRSRPTHPTCQTARANPDQASTRA
jgi:hypothetical protein